MPVITQLGLCVVGLLFSNTAVHAQLLTDLPQNMQDVGVEQRIGESLPLNAKFLDESGRKVVLGEYFKSEIPVLLTLNYSDCPMLCSMQLNKLVESLSELSLKVGRDFQIVTVSIDPRESPYKAKQTKAKYIAGLRQPGASDGWHFLTGQQSEIRALSEAVGFRYKFIPETGEFSHAAMLGFCTPDGNISSYLLLIDYPPEQLKLGLLDAGGGKIGNLVDNFLLYCSVYNAAEGSYTASAWKIMRVCGALTVILLLVGLVPYWLGKRKPAGHQEGHASSFDPGRIGASTVAGPRSY
ncbi:MAG: SCO family protein [Pirellulaceae bacterium]